MPGRGTTAVRPALKPSPQPAGLGALPLLILHPMVWTDREVLWGDRCGPSSSHTLVPTGGTCENGL